MTRDRIDLLVSQWRRERPDLDPTPMEVVGRMLRLARHLEQTAEEAIRPFDLALWEFDVLVTLRRQGAPYRLPASRLARASMLSGGAMTHRVDRLEKRGLLERLPDPDDRRGVLVGLSRAGVELADRAIAERLAEAAERVRPLGERDRDRLARLLRSMLLALPGEEVAEESR